MADPLPSGGPAMVKQRRWADYHNAERALRSFHHLDGGNFT